MKTSYGIGVITAAAVVSAALVLAPVRSLGQATGDEKARAKAELKAKQIALTFQNNATVVNLYDRQGKAVGTVGERALYGQVAMSPDKTRVAVVKTDLTAEKTDLLILDVATGKSIQMTNSGSREFVQTPVWSPDGSQVAYVALRGAQEALYRKDSSGEGPEELLYKNPGLGMAVSDWSLDGRFVAFAKSDLTGGALYILALADQGERQPIEVFKTEKQVGAPRFSPNGRYLSYVAVTQPGKPGEIFVMALFDVSNAPPTTGPWQLTEGGTGSAAAWKNDGKELYFVGVDRSVMVADVSTSATFQFQKPRVLFRPPGAVPVPMQDVSRDGQRFAGLPPPRGPQLQQITIFDRAGKVISKIGEPGLFGAPAFSPDGTRLAVVRGDLATGRNEIWTFDIATGKYIAIKSDLPLGAPMWSADGKRFYYTSLRGTYNSIYRRPSDGTGEEEFVFRYTPGAGFQLTDISPDEKMLTISSGGVLLMVPLTGNDPLARQAIEFDRGEFNTDLARFSADGKFVAFRSDETDRTEVYVRPLDPSTGKAIGEQKWRVSKDGVQGMLHWRADGKELFFRGVPGTNDLLVTSVELTTTPTVQAGTSKVLFTLPGPQGGNLGNISRDGQRFVFAINIPAQ